jgi:sulfotransferase family protein
VDALKSGLSETTDPVELHRRNVRLAGERDVMIAGYPGSGSALLGNILTELGFAHVDPYSEVVGADGTSRVIPDLVAYRSRLAATAAADEAGHVEGRGLRFFKNHLAPRHFDGVSFGGAVLLVRDPRDAVHSSYRWFRGFSPFWQPEGGKGQGTFLDFLDGLGVNDEPPIQSWVDFYRAWHAALPGLHRSALVRFEDLKADPAAVTARLLRAFDVTMPRAAIEHAVERSSYENMRAHEKQIVARQTGNAGTAPDQPLIMRRGKVNEWREWFDDPALAARFREPALVEVAALFGYRLDTAIQSPIRTAEGDDRDGC